MRLNTRRFDQIVKLSGAARPNLRRVYQERDERVRSSHTFFGVVVLCGILCGLVVVAVQPPPLITSALSANKQQLIRAMTVNDFEMNVRARGMRAGDDDTNEEQWKELAGLSDGRREKWMTDRAKNALGTPK